MPSNLKWKEDSWTVLARALRTPDPPLEPQYPTKPLLVGNKVSRGLSFQFWDKPLHFCQ